MSVEVGQAAPEFNLRDENNQEVKLSDLKGSSVVLMFYPLDFSPLCTKEHCTMRDSLYEDFQQSGARVFGVSRDSTWTHKAYKEKENLPYSLLADMNGKVAREYGAWNEQVGLAERMTVLIDEDGMVRFTQRSENLGVARDQSETLAALNP